MPVRGTLKPFNRNQVTEVQQMLQIQPCEPKQESQNIRPIRGNSQIEETQRQVNPKLTKKNPEVFKPARVTPDQEIFHSQTKQVSVHQTPQHVTSFKENLKSFNQDQATEFKRMLQIQACKPQQDSRPNKQNPKVSIQQRVTPNREIVSVEIQELQNQLKPIFIKENLEVSKQQQVTPNHQILQVQTQKAQRQKEPSVIKAQKQKIQRHKDPSPSKKNSQVVNQPKRINPTRNHHITQVKIQDTQGCVEQQQVQDIETQQGQQKVTVSENHNKRVRLTQETPSPTQSLQQVSIKHDSQRKQESQEEKDDSTRPKDKIDNPLIQVQELSLGIPKPFSTQKLQKPMNNLDVLQQKDYDLVSTDQDKFFKVFKSPKKRHRNYACR
ncbi:zinc finger protein 853-like [Teleopsis dalmanni]|uniref:zinc finger protein 853-like n=1 Tax=Teleopsis dalmanni TaxID=139649 RepID=UPI0018CCB596|nr:zinc finger protein 853-like [Teleopsis dalmanni]